MSAVLAGIQATAATLANLLAQVDGNLYEFRNPYHRHEWDQIRSANDTSDTPQPARWEDACANCNVRFCPLSWTDEGSEDTWSNLGYVHTAKAGGPTSPDVIWPLCSLFCKYCFEIKHYKYEKAREIEWRQIQEAKHLLAKTKAYLKEQSGVPPVRPSRRQASKPATTLHVS